MQDIKRVYTLFLDVARSKDFLEEYQKDYVFGEDRAPHAEQAAAAADVHQMLVD